MKIDRTKTYRTKSGQDVVIYRVCAEGVYPVHGAIGSASYSWTTEGHIVYGDRTDGRDLVEVKEKRSEWINIYPRSAGGYNTREMANALASENRIACIRVTYTDGEGLDNED